MRSREEGPARRREGTSRSAVEDADGGDEQDDGEREDVGYDIVFFPRDGELVVDVEEVMTPGSEGEGGEV